jgi:hypothetical protein
MIVYPAVLFLSQYSSHTAGPIHSLYFSYSSLYYSSFFNNMRVSSLLSLALTAAAAAAYDIPANLQTFYDGVKNGGCKSFLKGDSNLQDGQGNKGFGFCNDLPGAVYLSGPGELGDMDIDCDGTAECGGDGDHQSQTAFDSELQEGGYGLKSLAADKQPYVVLGTNDVPVDTLSGGPVSPLSVVAVVCNNQLHYGIFGEARHLEYEELLINVRKAIPMATPTTSLAKPPFLLVRSVSPTTISAATTAMANMMCSTLLSLRRRLFLDPKVPTGRALIQRPSRLQSSLLVIK